MKYNGENVGIIHDGKGSENWDIAHFKELFEQRGVDVALFNANDLNDFYSKIRDVSDFNSPELNYFIEKGYGLWMNRIYPSGASVSSINKGLNMVAWLNAEGFQTINPLNACKADYDKFFAWQLMEKEGVSTPKTRKLTQKDTLQVILDEFSLPLIIKKNTGGKGIGVSRVDYSDRLEELMRDPDILSGRYLVQEFIKPERDHDIRVGVIDGESLISYGRTLVAKNGEQPWMASCNHGSQIIPYQASDDECDLAVRASKAIDANLNEVDIQITSRGPVVIENNPTPGYDKGEEHWVKLIVDHITGTDNL